MRTSSLMTRDVQTSVSSGRDVPFSEPVYVDERFLDARYHSANNRTTSTRTTVPTSTSTTSPTSNMSLTLPRTVQTSMSRRGTVPIVQASISARGTVSLPTSTRDMQTSTSTTEIASTSTRNVVAWSEEVTNAHLHYIFDVIGRPQASSWAVAMLPRVEKVEQGDGCVICLEEWSRGDMGTELPCKHKYHFECVEKWLRIHATCPQCRYEMPLAGEYVMENVEVSVDDSDDDEDSSHYDSSDSA